jgi:hypothetical protein
MQNLSRHTLVLTLLALPAVAQVQIPTEAEARQAYYDCLYAYIAEKTEWDATPDQLVTAAESTCDTEYNQLLLAILKGRPDIAKMSDKPISLAKEIRQDLVEQARKDMKRIIFEERHRPKAE